MKVERCLIFVCLLIGTIGCDSKKDCNPRKEITKVKGNTELRKVIDECHDDVIVSEREWLRISPDSAVPNGYHKEYYSNGNLKLLAFWKLGVQDSICIAYSEKGNKISESFMSDGSFIGPQKEYYSDGKIKTIVYQKNDTAKWFGIEFDTHGGIAKLGGKPLRIVASPGYERQKKGDRFVSIFEVPVLNNIRTELKIVLLQEGKVAYDTTVTKFSHDKANFDYYPYVIDFKKTGQYELIASTRLISENNWKLIVEDSTHLPITVK